MENRLKIYLLFILYMLIATIILFWNIKDNLDEKEKIKEKNSVPTTGIKKFNRNCSNYIYIEKKIHNPEENKIYIITPTYSRPEQMPLIIQLSHTLRLVPNLQWIVVEDSNVENKRIKRFLETCNISYIYLVAPMPKMFQKLPLKKRPRGVANRNRAIRWLRKNVKSGIMFFADDDNIYDLRLFQEIRTTQKVSMWPVAFCSKFGWSSPIVKNGHLIGFYDSWLAKRKFPVDMAGFAVSIPYFLQSPNARMPYIVGYEEEGFLRSLPCLQHKDIELKADNCSRFLVWHTKISRIPRWVPLDTEMYKDTNLVELNKQLVTPPPLINLTSLSPYTIANN